PNYYSPLLHPPPPRSTHFPYTTLFRSQGAATPTATTETAPATTVATAEESVAAAAAVTGDSNDASSVIPSRAANASPVPTEGSRSEEHTSELQSRGHLVCRLLLEKKNI